MVTDEVKQFWQHLLRHIFREAALEEIYLRALHEITVDGKDKDFILARAEKEALDALEGYFTTTRKRRHDK